MLGHVTKHFNYIYHRRLKELEDKNNKEKKKREQEVSGLPWKFRYQKYCSKNSILVVFLLSQGSFASWYSWFGVGSIRFLKVNTSSSEEDLKKR